MINVNRLLKVPVGMVGWVRSIEGAVKELQNTVRTLTTNTSAGSPKSYISTVPLQLNNRSGTVGELVVDDNELSLTAAWAGVRKLFSFTKLTRPAGGGTEDVPELDINAVGIKIRELPTKGNAANIYMDNNGTLYKQNSASKYKRDISEADTGDLIDILDRLYPVEYRMKTEGVEGDKYFGFIAEDVAGISAPAHRFVEWNGGEPSGVQYASLVVALTAGYQQLAERVTMLEDELGDK